MTDEQLKTAEHIKEKLKFFKEKLEDFKEFNTNFSFVGENQVRNKTYLYDSTKTYFMDFLLLAGPELERTSKNIIKGLQAIIKDLETDFKKL